MATNKVTTFKIFAGNVPDGTTSEEIRQIFEEFGTVVECDCLGNRAFIHMEDDIEGKHAIGQLQERELNGNKLQIEESKNFGLPRIPTVKLLVKNISSSIDARGLRNMFKKFGYVVEAEIQNSKGHVCLEATGDIRSAIDEVNGHVIEDMALSVEPAPTDTASSQPQSNALALESPSPKKFKSSQQNTNSNGQGLSWKNRYCQGPEQYSQEVYEEDYGSNSYESEYNDFNSHMHNQYDYESEYNDFNSHAHNQYDYEPTYYDRPFMPPRQSQFRAPPERILRDPYGQPPPQFQLHASGPDARFRGPHTPHPPMGSRGAPQQIRMLSHRGGPVMGGMGNRMRLMGPGMPQHGGNFRGGPHHTRFQNAVEPNFYSRGELPPCNPGMGYNEEVFYEDEPLPTSSSRSRMGVPRMNLSGANSIPIGNHFHPNPQFVARDPVPLIPNLPTRRGGRGSMTGRGSMGGRGSMTGRGGMGGRGSMTGRGGMGGRGGMTARGGRKQFTALTGEVAPGEKYPVPPMHNPSFRAPLKWPKEEVNHKVKRKKKPLIPAELPDYSVPVPDLPKQIMPKGAVLKPFPAPFMGQANRSNVSQMMDVDLNYSSSTLGADHDTPNYSQAQNNPSSHIDFTSDDFV